MLNRDTIDTVQFLLYRRDQAFQELEGGGWIGNLCGLESEYAMRNINQINYIDISLRRIAHNNGMTVDELTKEVE